MNVIYSYVWKGSHGCGKLGNLRNVKIVISRPEKSIWSEYNLKSQGNVIVNVMLNSVIWVLYIYYYSIY